MKCKRCKKGELIFVINFGEEGEKLGFSYFKKQGQIWVCDKCGKCIIIKKKEEQ